MIKKLISDALLFVVLDKKARNKLKRNKGAAEDEAPNAGPQTFAMTRDKRHNEVWKALDFAQRKVATRGEATPERRALIQQAISILRSKTALLDDLSQEQRDKLYIIAMKTFQLDPTAEDDGPPD